jgi:hypothetical protein
MLNLRHAHDLPHIPGHRHRRHAGIAVDQAPLRVAQSEQHRIRGGQVRRDVGAGIEGDLAVLDVHMRHHRIRSLLEATIAADDTGRDVVQVVNEAAAQSQQHQRNRQPKHQLTADRGSH